ncbi:MAG: hypothetical protein HZA04_07690 [Nitrospinae bacterium]|nr:hypothetical protein [Nitrospinota bacterium]
MDFESRAKRIAREMEQLEIEIRGYGLIASSIYPPGVNVPAMPFPQEPMREMVPAGVSAR